MRNKHEDNTNLILFGELQLLNPQWLSHTKLGIVVVDLHCRLKNKQKDSISILILQFFSDIKAHMDIDLDLDDIVLSLN